MTAPSRSSLKRPFPHADRRCSARYERLGALHHARAPGAAPTPSPQIQEIIGSGPFRFMRRAVDSGSTRGRTTQVRPTTCRDAEPAEHLPAARSPTFNRVEWTRHSRPRDRRRRAGNGEIDWCGTPDGPTSSATLKANRLVTGQVADPAGRLAIMRLNHLHSRRSTTCACAAPFVSR
jgi:hypothetical protein